MYISLGRRERPRKELATLVVVCDRCRHIRLPLMDHFNEPRSLRFISALFTLLAKQLAGKIYAFPRRDWCGSRCERSTSVRSRRDILKIVGTRARVGSGVLILFGKSGENITMTGRENGKWEFSYGCIKSLLVLWRICRVKMCCFEHVSSNRKMKNWSFGMAQKNSSMLRGWDGVVGVGGEAPLMALTAATITPPQTRFYLSPFSE